MHIFLIILGVVLAIPLLLAMVLIGGLALAESRGENPFM